jgi:hypothetical protein
MLSGLTGSGRKKFDDYKNLNSPFSLSSAARSKPVSEQKQGNVEEEKEEEEEEKKTQTQPEENTEENVDDPEKGFRTEVFKAHVSDMAARESESLLILTMIIPFQLHQTVSQLLLGRNLNG